MKKQNIKISLNIFANQKNALHPLINVYVPVHITFFPHPDYCTLTLGADELFTQGSCED